MAKQNGVCSEVLHPEQEKVGISATNLVSYAG